MRGYEQQPIWEYGRSHEVEWRASLRFRLCGARTPARSYRAQRGMGLGLHALAVVMLEIGYRMNHKQKVALSAVLVSIATMLFFPPFHIRGMNGVTVNLGYGFLFNPPTIGSGTPGAVDIGMLITQWIGVLIIGGIAFIMLRGK